MIFKEGQAIFIQIAERICDEILAGKYEADARIPGVRDYSVTLEVNVNTTVKAYEQLAQRGVSIISADWAILWPPMHNRKS